MAGLLLARGVTRRKEFAVRLALGASRGRIMRQLLVESLLVAVAGGAAGLAVALWGVDLLTRFKPSDATGFWTAYASAFRFYSVGVDGVVLVFNFGLSVATGLLPMGHSSADKRTGRRTLAIQRPVYSLNPLRGIKKARRQYACRHPRPTH